MSINLYFYFFRIYSTFEVSENHFAMPSDIADCYRAPDF